MGSVSASLALMLIGLVTGVLAARGLGPEHRGLLGIIVFWIQLLANASRLPISEAILVHANQAEGCNRLALAWGSYRVAQRVSLLLAFALFPLSSAVLYLILELYSAPFLEISLILLGLTLLSRTQNEGFLGLIYVLQDYRKVNTMRLVVPVVYLLGVIAAIQTDLAVTGFLLAHCVSMIAAYLYRLTQFPQKHSAIVDQRDCRDVIRRAFSLHGLSLTSIFTKQADKLVLYVASPATFIGQYIVAFTLLAPVQSVLNTALTTIGFPVFAGSDADAMEEIAYRMLRMAVTASLLLSLSISLVGPFVVTVLFGPEYHDAGQMIRYLAVATVLMPIRTAAAQLLKATGDVRTPLHSEFVYGLAFLAAFFPAHGESVLMGAVAGFGLGNLASLAVLVVALCRRWPGLVGLGWALPGPAAFRDILAIVIHRRKKQKL
ncbi:Membrane protein involved in the export of O-antigen and teichoic acid [Marinovum algicola DG 898]|nr:Membrane protein involved in the export of O-antigen and teichoic acid [Marinovum algicola DG 898]